MPIPQDAKAVPALSAIIDGEVIDRISGPQQQANGLVGNLRGSATVETVNSAEEPSHVRLPNPGE